MRFRKHASTGLLLALSAIVVASPSGALAKSHTKPHKPHRSAGAVHKTHTVSFYARVVRASAKGLVVRTTSGKLLSFSAKQLKPAVASKPRKDEKPTPPHKPSKHPKRPVHRIQHAPNTQAQYGNIVVNIIGLQPGVLVQITETTDSSGNVTITITLPPTTPIDQQASGTVTEVETDAFTVQTSDGSDLSLNMSEDQLNNLNLQTCDTVDVAYHQDAGLLIADTVTITGASTSGDCAPTQDDTGVITAVSQSGLTMTDSNTGLPDTFEADPSSGVTDGFQVGDLVDVTYTQNSDGSLEATNVQYVEEGTSGTVTSVSEDGTMLTITDDNTGLPDTFIADPSNGVQITAQAFNGVSVGDEIDVCYHQSAGQLVADTVTVQ